MGKTYLSIISNKYWNMMFKILKTGHLIYPCSGWIKSEKLKGTWHAVPGPARTRRILPNVNGALNEHRPCKETHSRVTQISMAKHEWVWKKHGLYMFISCYNGINPLNLDAFIPISLVFQKKSLLSLRNSSGLVVSTVISGLNPNFVLGNLGQGSLLFTLPCCRSFSKSMQKKRINMSAPHMSWMCCAGNILIYPRMWILMLAVMKKTYLVAHPT